MGQSWLADPNADGDEAHDRKRPEQLCRYLTDSTGCWHPTLALIERIAALVPPPRTHRSELW